MTVVLPSSHPTLRASACRGTPHAIAEERKAALQQAVWRPTSLERRACKTSSCRQHEAECAAGGVTCHRDFASMQFEDAPRVTEQGLARWREGE